DALRTLSLTVRQAVLDGALQQSQLALARELAESTERTRALDERRLRSGAVSEAELARAEVAALQAQQVVDLTEQALIAARLQIAFLPGWPGGVGTGRAPAADADVRGAAPAADLLPAVGRDRARRGGPARAADPAGEAAGASADRCPAGKRGRRGKPPPGAAAADPPPRARPPGPRPGAGAIREGRRVAAGAARRPEDLGSGPRRLPQGPARLLALRVPAGRSGGAHMRRALPLLLLLSCARREEREQARPPAG